MVVSYNNMNITLQVHDGYKYSILLQQDFTRTDFITAVKKANIKVEDYIFFARGKKLNLEDEIEFNSQKPLFTNTYIILSLKTMNTGAYV